MILEVPEAFKAQERFINRVDFKLRRELAQHRYDTAAQIAVERVVRRAHDDPVRGECKDCWLNTRHGHTCRPAFFVDLFEEDKLAVPAPVLAIPPAATLAGLSLLVVDDMADARESLRELLQHLGAKVSVAGSGREGLDIVREAGPDLVLCDLRMPRMDGFEFIRQLNCEASPAPPPVVAVTALTSEADHQRTREAGFDGHINKPYDEVAIVAAVFAALQRHPDADPAAMPGTQTR